MNNNDELALKLKTLTIAAKGEGSGTWVAWLECYREVFENPNGLRGRGAGKRVAVFSTDEQAYFAAMACPANILALLAERDADKKRIAELEARTVSVKLPHDSELEFVADRCNRHRKAQQAAGIKLEVGE